MGQEKGRGVRSEGKQMAWIIEVGRAEWPEGSGPPCNLEVLRPANCLFMHKERGSDVRPQG